MFKKPGLSKIQYSHESIWLQRLTKTHIDGFRIRKLCGLSFSYPKSLALGLSLNPPVPWFLTCPVFWYQQNCVRIQMRKMSIMFSAKL